MKYAKVELSTTLKNELGIKVEKVDDKEELQTFASWTNDLLN